MMFLVEVNDDKRYRINHEKNMQKIAERRNRRNGKSAPTPVATTPTPASVPTAKVSRLKAAKNKLVNKKPPVTEDLHF